MTDELKLKVSEAMNSSFIGEIPFSNKELEEIKEEIYKSKYQYLDRKRKESTYLIKLTDSLIVLIVNLCKVWDIDNENKFWRMVFDEIFDDPEISSNLFYDLFESALKNHNKKVFVSKRNRRMFREYFLSNALAPASSLESFIRLVWSWYSDPEILDFDVRQEEFLFEAMSKYLNTKFANNYDNNNEVDFGGKLYSIRAAFKYLFISDVMLGKRLIKTTLGYIDEKYYKDSVTTVSYLSKNCEKVVSDILVEMHDDKSLHKKRKTKKVVTDFSKIRARYEYNADTYSAYLMLPEIRILLDDADEYRLEVYSNETKIDQVEGYIVGNDLKRRIKPIELDLNNYDSYFIDGIHLSLKLYILGSEEEKLIYDSKEHLYRSFVLFSNNREITSRIRKPGVFTVLHEKYYNLYKSGLEYKDLSNTISSILTKENDKLSIHSKTIFFSSVSKKIYITLDDKYRIKSFFYCTDDVECSVYNQYPSIYFGGIDKNINPNSIYIFVDDNNVGPLLSSTQLEGEQYKMNEDLLEKNNGFHTVTVVDTSNSNGNSILNSVSFYVDNLVVESRSDFIFDIYSHPYKIAKRDEVLFNDICPLGEETIEIEYDEGLLRYNLPIVKWRIDDNKWNYAGSEDIYWKDDSMVHNNSIVELEIPQGIHYELKVEDSLIEESSNNRFKLGNKLVELRDEPECRVTLSIGNKEILLFMVENEPLLTDLTIDNSKDTIDFGNNYDGMKEVSFNIQLRNKINKYNFTVDFNGKFDQTIEDGIYEISVTAVDNFFGNEYEVYQDDEFVIGDAEKKYFNRSIIHLEKFNVYTKKGKEKVKNLIIQNIKFRRIDDTLGKKLYVYSGILKIKKLEIPVEIHKKDNRYLKLYIDNKEGECIHYDLNKKAITQEKCNDHIVAVSSFEYKKEEF